ncbi:MAG: TIGR02444 family protein, partial [Pseudomonadota bacterium]
MKSPEGFVRTIYAKPGVADACLRLQEGGDVDVVVLLWALWRAMAGVGAPDAAAVEAAARRTAPWRAQVVRPLRAIRRTMKAGVPGAPRAAAEPLRGKIKGLEIEAELFALA